MDKLYNILNHTRAELKHEMEHEDGLAGWLEHNNSESNHYWSYLDGWNISKNKIDKYYKEIAKMKSKIEKKWMEQFTSSEYEWSDESEQHILLWVGSFADGEYFNEEQAKKFNKILEIETFKDVEPAKKGDNIEDKLYNLMYIED